VAAIDELANAATEVAFVVEGERPHRRIRAAGGGRRSVAELTMTETLHTEDLPSSDDEIERRIGDANTTARNQRP
jgi:hypothetical protein